MTGNTVQRRDAWYHQPIAWLGILVFLSLLAGCVWTVVIATRYTDHPQHGNARMLLGVPLPATASSAEQP